MKTMSHTEKQRKDWHAGKRKKRFGESRMDAFIRAAKRCNLRGALTPANTKRGIFYKPK
jgi:hypothetical protein